MQTSMDLQERMWSAFYGCCLRHQPTGSQPVSRRTLRACSHLRQAKETNMQLRARLDVDNLMRILIRYWEKCHRCVFCIFLRPGTHHPFFNIARAMQQGSWCTKYAVQHHTFEQPLKVVTSAASSDLRAHNSPLCSGVPIWKRAATADGIVQNFDCRRSFCILAAFLLRLSGGTGFGGNGIGTLTYPNLDPAVFNRSHSHAPRKGDAPCAFAHSDRLDPGNTSI